MNVQQTQGLVLRLYPFSDTSLIVHWLTPDCGRLSTLAKGARRPKSPFLGKLDLYFHARLSFHRSARSELHQLREVVVIESHEALRRDWDVLRLAAYAAALIEANTETDTELPEYFEVFDELLDALPHSGAHGLLLTAYESRLLELAGFGSDAAAAPVSAGCRQFLARLTELPFRGLPVLKPSRSQAGEIQSYIHKQLVSHLIKPRVARPAFPACD